MNPSTFPATNRSTQKNIWKTTTKGNSSSKKPNLHQLTLYWTALAPTKTLYFVLKKKSNGIEQVGRDYFFWYVSGIFFSKLLRSNFAKKMGTPHPWWTAHITVAGTKSRQMIHGWSMDSRWSMQSSSDEVTCIVLIFGPPHLRKMNRSLGANKQKKYLFIGRSLGGFRH